MNNKWLNFVLLLFLTCTSSIFDKNDISKITKGICDNKASSKNIDGIYKFTGELNGKIPVFLCFVLKDSVLKGEVTYLKTAKRLPITIIGTIKKDEGLVIYEFIKDGYISGIYRGEFKKEKLKGVWYKPGSETGLGYNLISKDTLLTGIDSTLKSVSINGEYLYRFGKMGSSGSVGIKQIDQTNFRVDINCVTASPSNNIADLETFKAKMADNIIFFKMPNADCRFKIRAFNNFIVIDYIGKSRACGFGLNAGVEGVFIKTSTTAELR